MVSTRTGKIAGPLRETASALPKPRKPATRSTASSSRLPPTLAFQSCPVESKHRKTVSTIPFDKRYSPFTDATLSLHVHQRLMQVLEMSPLMAVFPWLIDMRYVKGASRKKAGDKAYTKSVSALFSWPLDGRRTRLGLVVSYSETERIRVSHAWVIGIVKHRDPKKGVLVFIYDDAGSAAHETMRKRGSGMALPLLINAQREILANIKDRGITIKALFFGGRPYTAQIEQCLENAVTFCERLGTSMASAADFDLQMIKDQGLEQMSLHSRKNKATPKEGDGGAGGEEEEEEIDRSKEAEKDDEDTEGEWQDGDE